MLGKEIYRIFSRRIVLFAVIAALVYIIYSNFFDIWGEAVIDNGNIYRRASAVAKDKEIAAEFAGPLTEEAVREIWEKYGVAVNYLNRNTTEENLVRLAEEGGNDNYCNRFVLGYFAERTVTADGRVTFTLPEDLSGSRYLDGSYYFDYAGDGWGWYWDHLLLIFVMVSVVTIVALSPVFSEDYAFRTADIILPTVKGRGKIWLLRTGSDILFASVYYWFVCAVTFLQELAVYGSEGLRVSCGLTGVPMYWFKDNTPVWRALLVLHLCGWFSLLVLILTVQAISARCRQSFASVLWSLTAYLAPVAVIECILDNLPMGRANYWLHIIGYSTPFFFPGVYIQASPGRKLLLIVLALTSAFLGAVLGARSWCRHQVRG